jgi:TonB family protein
MLRSLRRVGITLALVATAVLSCHARGLAAGCPPQIGSLVPVGADEAGRSQTFGLRVAAATAQSNLGDVTIFTDRGEYNLALSNLTLTSNDNAKNPAFISSLLYVKFDEPVRIVEAWVAHAPSTPSCNLPLPRLPSQIAPPQPDDQLLPARKVIAQTQASCVVPYADATLTQAFPLKFPIESITEELVVLIEVVVGHDGRVLDYRVVKNSGNFLADNAALRAMRLSTYSPRIINCVPVPGTYVFRVDFVITQR